MSQTTVNKCPSQTVTFSDDAYSVISHRVHEDVVIVGLLAGLYGLLTILSIFSIYSLIQRSRGIQPTMIVLSFTIFVLFTSTTIYTITFIRSYYYTVLETITLAIFFLWDSSIPIVVPIGFDVSRFYSAKATLLRACAGTATLTLNVICGDAIVCWRACVVWHENRIVKAICAVFLLATCVLGVVDTATGFSHPGGMSLVTSSNLYSLVPSGTMFQGLPAGVATCILSLSTNIMATLLVAYKAWLSRKRLREYLAAGRGSSQVQRVLALLVESGAVYCAFWVIIVAFQIKYYNNVSNNNPLVTSFLDSFGIFMTGALVPAIAIYPLVIIVLVALNRSHMEKGLTQNLDSLPTPHIAVTINTTMGTRHRSEAYTSRPSEILVIDGQGFGCEDGAEDTSEYAGGGSKVEKVMEP